MVHKMDQMHTHDQYNCHKGQMHAPEQWKSCETHDGVQWAICAQCESVKM